MSQKQVTENKTETKISVCDIMKNNTSKVIKKLEMRFLQVYSNTLIYILHISILLMTYLVPVILQKRNYMTN